MDTGRPTKYKEEYNEQAEKICAMFGAVDSELADFFKVSESTINGWKESHPIFLESIKSGKDKFDTKKVEDSLLRRALGYETVETHEEAVGDSGDFVTKKVTKHVISDTAIIFWLKNRNRKRWSDSRNLEVTGEDGGPIKTVTATITPDMDAKEAAAIYSQMLKGDDE